MPLTKKGQKIMRAMKNEYGPDRGEQVFYASRNKGTIEGVEKLARGGTVGKKSFPDLNKDGKVTKADVLKGRGVEGFSEGGRVRRPAPVEEPSSDDALTQALEEERRIREANEPAPEKKSSRRGDDKPVIKKAMGGMVNYAEGGMVRGCKSVQMSGKGFKGTF